LKVNGSIRAVLLAMGYAIRTREKSFSFRASSWMRRVVIDDNPRFLLELEKHIVSTSQHLHLKEKD